MRLPILILCFLPFLTLAAQESSLYLDIVHLKNGRRISGTLQHYVPDGEATMLRANGEIMTIPAGEVRRVDYLRMRSRGWGEEAKVSYTPPVVPVPTGWLHAIEFGLPMGITQERGVFGGRERQIGAMASYHLLRQFPRWGVGVGPEYLLMSRERREQFAALTALLEYRLPLGRIQPTLRTDTGVILPLDQPGNAISERSTSLLVRPGIGLTFRAGRRMLTADLSYHFFQTRYLTEDENFQVFERRITYRRFTLRSGVRF